MKIKKNILIWKYYGRDSTYFHKLTSFEFTRIHFLWSSHNLLNKNDDIEKKNETWSSNIWNDSRMPHFFKRQFAILKCEINSIHKKYQGIISFACSTEDEDKNESRRLNFQQF